MQLAIEFFHLFGMALLIGGGIANGVVLGKAGTSDDMAKTALRAASRRLGQITFVGLLILWGSGVYMVTMTYGDFLSLPLLLWGKLAVVLILSVSAVAAQIYSIIAIFSGGRTPRQKVIRMTAITTLVGLVALVLTVIIGPAPDTAAMEAAVPPAEKSAPVSTPESDTAEPAAEEPEQNEMPAEPSST